MEIRIWEARNKINVSLQELSKRTGVSASALWNYENERRNPGVYTLEKIAKALNTSISDLYDSEYK